MHYYELHDHKPWQYLVLGFLKHVRRGPIEGTGVHAGPVIDVDGMKGTVREMGVVDQTGFLLQLLRKEETPCQMQPR